jgi:ribosomal protein L19E
VLNASKAAYRKELQNLTSLPDSAAVDKVNFIKAYANARGSAYDEEKYLFGLESDWKLANFATESPHTS